VRRTTIDHHGILSIIVNDRRRGRIIIGTPKLHIDVQLRPGFRDRQKHEEKDHKQCAESYFHFFLHLNSSVSKKTRTSLWLTQGDRSQKNFSSYPNAVHCAYKHTAYHRRNLSIRQDSMFHSRRGGSQAPTNKCTFPYKFLRTLIKR
jgi:hypothetical protein